MATMRGVDVKTINPFSDEDAITLFSSSALPPSLSLSLSCTHALSLSPHLVTLLFPLHPHFLRLHCTIIASSRNSDDFRSENFRPENCENFELCNIFHLHLIAQGPSTFWLLWNRFDPTVPVINELGFLLLNILPSWPLTPPLERKSLMTWICCWKIKRKNTIIVAGDVRIRHFSLSIRPKTNFMRKNALGTAVKIKYYTNHCFC